MLLDRERRAGVGTGGRSTVKRGRAGGERERVDVYRRRERVLNASLFRRRAEAGALGC